MNINEAEEAKKRGAALQSQPLSEEDEALLDGEGGSPKEDEPQKKAPEPGEAREVDGMPAWVVVPPGFKFPKKGRMVWFVRFKAELTDTPDKGDRQAILTALTEADEKVARKRAIGDSGKVMQELSKQMIRAIDGELVDWTGKSGPGNPNMLFRDVGYVYRQELQNIFIKSHQFTPEQREDFFMNCFSVMTVAG